MQRDRLVIIGHGESNGSTLRAFAEALAKAMASANLPPWEAVR